MSSFMLKYYYLRDANNAPRITRCVIRTHRGEIAVGTALCSISDFPNKKVGRRIARQRALYALENKESVLPINRERAVDVIVITNADDLDYEYNNRLGYTRDFKGVYGKEYLNPFEKQLLQIN